MTHEHTTKRAGPKRPNGSAPVVCGIRSESAPGIDSSLLQVIAAGPVFGMRGRTEGNIVLHVWRDDIVLAERMTGDPTNATCQQQARERIIIAPAAERPWAGLHFSYNIPTLARSYTFHAIIPIL